MKDAAQEGKGAEEEEHKGGGAVGVATVGGDALSESAVAYRNSLAYRRMQPMRLVIRGYVSSFPGGARETDGGGTSARE